MSLSRPPHPPLTAGSRRDAWLGTGQNSRLLRRAAGVGAMGMLVTWNVSALG